MYNRKGYFAEKGLPGQPKQGCGIFAYRPKHGNIAELDVGFSNDENALIFQIIQLSKTGLHIKQYLMAGGTADIVAHPLLEDNLEGMGFLLDMSVLKQKVYKDIVLKTAIQADEADERKDQYKGTIGLKLGLLDNHRRIKGVTSIAG